VQAHRQSGLSAVCTDLLAFAGTEFYVRSDPSTAGLTFGEVSRTFDRGIATGLLYADGRIELNPPDDHVIGAGDQLVVLAEDDSLIHRGGSRPAITKDAITEAVERIPDPARTLMIGWNKRAPRIIDLLDEFATPGSHLQVAGLDEVQLGEYQNLTVGTTYCDPTNRAELESLDVGSYQHVIVLSADAHGEQKADARTLLTLLHLRDLEQRLGDPYSIVSEINDDANREIAQVTKADDFVVSEKLISLLLTQLTENRHLAAVFTELFSPDGAEIYLKPAADYLLTDRTANFATLAEAARRRGETAIGYRLHDRFHQPPAYGVALNPPKNAPLTLTAEDRVIVLADDGRSRAAAASPMEAQQKVTA
jgi:hypothetical protein